MNLNRVWGQATLESSPALEMPFKDNKARPDPVFGWSAARSAKPGVSILNPRDGRYCRTVSWRFVM